MSQNYRKKKKRRRIDQLVDHNERRRVNEMMVRQQQRPQNYRQNNYEYEEKLNSEIHKYFSPSEDF